MRCFKCQKFGHVRDRCSGEEVCGMCAKAIHEGPCDNPALCVNCGGNHPSSSQSCPTWQLEKQVQKVKAEKKIPFFEAKKMVQASQPSTKQTYAAVTKKKLVSVSCQTDFSMSVILSTLQEKVNAPGEGVKPATSQAAQQSKIPPAGQAGKPPLPPRPYESSALSGRGGHKVVMVEMPKKAASTKSVASKPPPAAGKSASSSGDRGKKGDKGVKALLRMADGEVEMD